MSSGPDLTSRILRHERALVAVMIATLTVLCWCYLAARSGAGAAASSMIEMAPPSLGGLVVMWWLMMVAMMLPSAAPAVLLYARVRRSRNGGAVIAKTWVFVAGYLATWLLFSIAAAVAQKLVTGPSMALDSRVAQAAVLGAAGAYQLSALKLACVHECRSPAEFLSRHWRPGWIGAVRLGLGHGAYCLGCCWMLMALLFVGGVMNLAWVVALTAIVAIEKLVPRGPLIGRVAGVAIGGWGIVKLLGY